MQQETATALPLVQAGFFRPVLDTLADAGINNDNLLRRVSLHRFDLQANENYVPVSLMYRLLDEVEREHGFGRFFAVFGPQIELQGLSDWGENVAFTPDVISACRLALEFDDVVQTHERMHFEINGPITTLSQYYQDQPQPGREFADYIDFCLMLNGLRIAGGPDWEPLEIHLQSRREPDFDSLLPENSGTRVYLGQPMTSVVFPTSMLTASMLGEKGSNGSSSYETPHSLPQVIEQLLSSALDGRTANLDVIADMLDMSPRTLRRRLSEFGTSFSALVDDWRFKSSLDLLALEELRIHEIAERLGYANTSNFERAFKRWTGEAPGLYRDHLS